jgi:hypothetical protein
VKTRFQKLLFKFDLCRYMESGRDSGENGDRDGDGDGRGSEQGPLCRVRAVRLTVGLGHFSRYVIFQSPHTCN